MFELCDKGDLYNYIKKYGHTITLTQRIQFIKDIISGYLFLYDNHFMHRDIKPENILLKSEKGEIVAKIGDFGLAKQFTQKQLNDVYFKSIVGTPLTMSPEIYFEKDYNVESDVWSLGSVFYFIIFEKFPFPAKSHSELAGMLDKKEYEMDLVGHEITYEVMSLILGCLQSNVKDRVSPSALKGHAIMSNDITTCVKSVKTGFKMQVYTSKSELVSVKEWMGL